MSLATRDTRRPGSSAKGFALGSITVAGNVKLVAGINIELTGIGKFSGKWHVVSSAHDLDNSSGHVTTAAIRKIEV